MSCVDCSLKLRRFKGGTAKGAVGCADACWIGWEALDLAEDCGSGACVTG